MGRTSRGLVGAVFAAVGVASCNVVAGLSSIKYSTTGSGGACGGGCNGGGPVETAGPGTGGFGMGGFGSGGAAGTGGLVATGGQSSSPSAVQSVGPGGGGTACECTPNATSTEACGNCGTATRTCGSNCMWGAYGTCEGEGACKPGASDSASCGNCGTHSRTCAADCTWNAYGTCTGEGACAPGATRTGCDPCGQEVCNNACAWGSTCEPQKQCLYKSGGSFQCCGAGKCQFCNEATCDWFACQDCSGCPDCGC
jgi:hypothetical protein